MTDYYKILGVTPQAANTEIKAAYRRLAKKYHPDAIHDHPEWTDKMYEIQEAYDVLGDEEKRKKYDESRLNQKKKAGQTQTGHNDTAPNPNMSQFEWFFGFQPGKGMETYRDNRPQTKKADGPINPDALFEAYFGKKK